jgi:3-oxoacyl-[acyl-carrier protein] reductase
MKIAFDCQRVIVTGAGHGFGRAISKAFADAGAMVWACDLNAAGLEETRKLCGKACEVRTLDVSDRAAVTAFVAEAAGGAAIDVLVNNAGGVRGQIGRPIEEISEQDWHTIFDVNVTGAFYFAQAATPGMKQKKRGRIINISSRAGLEISLTGIQAYASAKAAQIGLTRQLAHELGPWGITVNNVAPGFVRSNPTTERQWNSYGEAGQRKLVDSIALKRLGAPEDIAHAVMFFASDYAGWITGQVLSVDGGK